MDRTDKSFQGLLLSIGLHILLILILLKWQPPRTSQNETTEVTLVEVDKRDSKAKSFVTETDKKEKDVFEELKRQADFLSQYTKRVKKQMRAMNNGPTQNATVQARSAQQNTQTQAGQNNERGEGIGMPGQNNGQLMRNVAIGQSSIGEYIPGIEQGAFTALNTDQFTYYAFFARMNEQVRNRWVSLVKNYMSRISTQDHEKLSKAERQTMVEIILRPDGSYSHAVLHNSSGDKALDQTTSDAFRMAAPFPNPPRGMIEEDGNIHLRYGFVVHFRPP